MNGLLIESVTLSLETIARRRYKYYLISRMKRKLILLGLAKSEVKSAPNLNPLRPNNDVSQTSHCNIKGV